MIGREATAWAGAVGLALGSSLATGSSERAAVAAIARAEVREVEELAGLRAEDGSVRSSEPLSVEVVQEGGPTWVRDEVVVALREDDAVVSAGGPHLLVVEVVRDRSAWALSVRLHRSGWSLRSPRPARFHVAPWVATASALGGAALARRRGHWVLGVGVAAVVAQAIAAMLPWPAELPAVGIADTWRDGPLAQAVVGWARALPDAYAPVLAGVAVLCAILAFFDHRRTPNRGLSRVGVALVGIVAALAWVEASLRTSFAAWLSGPLGIVGALAIVFTWWLALRRRPRASRSP